MSNTLILGDLLRWQRRPATVWRARAPQSAARRGATLAALALLALAGGGCTGSRTYEIAVTGSIPAPLIEPVPQTIGVYYTPGFSAYTATEESLLGDTYEVTFGDLQQRYFQAMLEAAFESVVVADSAEPGVIESSNVDFFVVPRAEDFSFLTPTESGSKFFAVSMRHYIEFYRADGSPFGTWEINSYGRSRSSFAAKATRLAEEACADALRDMATSIIVGLPEQLRNRGIAPQAVTTTESPQSAE